jgi:CRISPR-associated protein (TIGR03984 family)
VIKLPDYAQELPAPAGDDAVPAWLAGQANDGRPFLLAFADDGIVWGRWAGGKLMTAAEAANATKFAAPLRGDTLWQASIFGPTDEVRLFRGEDGSWQARLITDKQDVIPESQLLSGDMFVEAYAGFTHLRDKRQQGLDHIPPVKLSAADLEAGRRARLLIHHQIDRDKATGEARIETSRLVDVTVGPTYPQDKEQ